LYRAKGTPEAVQQAEEWYRKELELDTLTWQETPGYDSRRDLGVTLSRIADLLRETGTPEALAAAKGLYLQKLPLDEENHRLTPCAQTKGDLKFTYARLYQIAKAKDTPEGKLEAGKWAQRYHELS
jgi:hypothetical protein